MRSSLPVLFLLPACAACPALAETPNIIVILADDLGYRDLGIQGSPLYETPAIDRLFREGMQFPHGYASAPVCSPTRASLLTGKTPARLKFTSIYYPPYYGRPLGPGDPGTWPKYLRLVQPNIRQELPEAEETLPEVLKDHGYRTALVGKWHLGPFRRNDGVPNHDPRDHGFDVAIGWGSAGSAYFPPYYVENLTAESKDDYLTDLLTDKAIEFIRAEPGKPFYLQLAHFAVHSPWQAPDALTEQFRAKVGEDAPHRTAVYAAMIARLDRSVARIRQALDEAGIAGETVIFFTSDNGPVENVNRGGGAPGQKLDSFSHGDHITSVEPMRGDKGTLFEGGIRVPTAVYWPGVTRGTSSTLPVATCDIFPTVLEMTGARRSQSGPIDGRSLVPLLRGQQFPPTRPLFFHFPHYTGGYTPPELPESFKQRPASAIREGEWKLIYFYENGNASLYNVVEDPGEENDRSSFRPDLTARLKDRLLDYLATADAQLPVPNPHNPFEQQLRNPN